MLRPVLNYSLLLARLLALPLALPLALSLSLSPSLAFTEEAWKPIGPNLVTNPSFEKATNDDLPAGWRASHAYYQSDDTTAHKGNRSLKYQNTDPSKYVFCNQSLTTRKGTAYRIRAWVKTKDVVGKDSGATICLEWRDKDGKYIAGCYPRGVKGTNDWTLVEGVTRPMPEGTASMTVQCYLRRNMSGTAWFDDVEVVRIQMPPMDSVILSPVYRGRITKDGPTAARVGVSVSLSDYETVRPEGVTLEWKLVGEKDAKVVRKGILNTAAFHASFDTQEGTIFEVPTDSLAVGDYTLSLRLLDENGEELDVDTHRLTRVPDDFHPAVVIDEHQRTLVKGKPFFPIGMYWGGVSEKDLKIFSNSRFNCIMPYAAPSREKMDLVHQHGLKVIFSIKDWCFGTRWTPKWLKSQEAEEPAIRKKVRELRDHPALLAWYLNDELPISFMPQLDAHQRFVAEEDPDHPTWVVLYQVKTVRKYLNSFDVIGTDPYPIGRAGDLGRPSMAADWTKITYDQVYKSRPMWQVPQTFNWGLYRKDATKEDLERFRTPSKAELRSMTWQCITEGAKGIIYYCWHNLRRNPDMPFEESWGNLKAVAAEVDRFAPILLSVEPAPTIRIETTDSKETPTWLHTTVRKTGNKLYLFTANDGNGEGRVEVSLPNGAKSAKELTEDVDIAVQGESFEVVSKRLDVKVYSILLEQP